MTDRGDSGLESSFHPSSGEGEWKEDEGGDLEVLV